MANNTFELVSKMIINKETEKFKPYKVTYFDKSGWVIKELTFNAVAGVNRHMLKLKGGHFKDGHGQVFTLSKGGKSDSGEKIKGEKLQIPWKDRFKPEVIENVAEFKKFIIDLEEYGKRYKLEKAVEKLNENGLTPEELLELGMTDVKAELELSKAKRKEFIDETDFADYLHTLIPTDQVQDKLFKIMGEMLYTEYQGKYYKKLVPNRIYLAEKDAEPSSTAQITIFFNKNSLDDSLLKKTNKYYVNGFIRNYDNDQKKEISAPVTLVIDISKNGDDEKIKKINTLMINQFTVKDKSWKELGVKVRLLDGSQKMEITMDMLNDTQKELLEMEAITLDEIRKEIGGDVYGEKVQEMVIINVAKGYSKGRKDTVMTDSDFVIQEKAKDDNEDIFDVDDSDIPY